MRTGGLIGMLLTELIARNTTEGRQAILIPSGIRAAEKYLEQHFREKVMLQELADMLGRDKRTIQKWERGEIRIALEDFLDVFDTLHLPVGPYEMWILHPELFPRGMEEIKGFSTEKKRRTLADYYLHQAAPLEIEQEYYILFGDHGSNRQELLANLQTPLRDRKRIVNQIIDNYYEARAIGHLTDPEGQQPVMPILEACYDASARSVKANENRYSIGSIEDYLDDAAKPAEE